MSYHEIDLGRHQTSISYGTTLGSWSLPLEVNFGGSGVREHGFGIGFLCFYFHISFWPKEYPVKDWTGSEDDFVRRFNEPATPEVKLESLIIEAECVNAAVNRIRNVAELLRGEFDKKAADDSP